MQTGRLNATKYPSRDIFPVAVIAKMMVQIAVVLGGLLVAAALAGQWIDARLNIGPWATVAVLLAAFGAGLILVFRIAQTHLITNETKQC